MAYVKGLLLSLIAILSPIQAVILTVFILVISDLITGMIVAYKKKQQISSAAMRRSVSKLLIYESAIILGYICQAYLTGDFLPFAKIVGGLIGLVEITSIYENLNFLSGNNLFKGLIKRLGSLNDK